MPMPNLNLDLGRRGFAPQLADVVRDARLLVGWTQRELAAKANTSQAAVWRIENALGPHLDLLLVERVLDGARDQGVDGPRRSAPGRSPPSA